MTLLVCLLLLAAAPAPLSAAAPKVQIEAIEKALTCQCGCGLTVHACNHLQCPSAIPLRREIRAQIAKGLDRAAILAYFEHKYGEKILSAPTTRGFNLLAWTVPFAALLGGAFFIGVTLRRWRRGTEAAGAEPDPGDGPDPYERILEEELRGFDQ